MKGKESERIWKRKWHPIIKKVLSCRQLSYIITGLRYVRVSILCQCQQSPYLGYHQNWCLSAPYPENTEPISSGDYRTSKDSNLSFRRTTPMEISFRQQTAKKSRACSLLSSRTCPAAISSLLSTLAVALVGIQLCS